MKIILEYPYTSVWNNLLRKDPVWYGQFGWPESNDRPYIWPTN